MRGTRQLAMVLVAMAAAMLLAGGLAVAATITGTSGDDNIKGTDGVDNIHGKGGNDTIKGMAGNDRVIGDVGDDVLYAGNAEGTVQTGDDLVAGEEGNDTLVGGPGKDDLRGGPGKDLLSEGPYNDEVVDYLSGGSEDDRIYAASGKDAVDVVSCQEGVKDEVWVDSVDSVASDCEIVHRDPAEAEVKFTTPLQVEQVLQISQSYDSRIEALFSDFRVGEPAWDVFTEFSQTTPEGIEQAYEKQRLAAFGDMLDSTTQMQPEDRAEMRAQVEAMQAAVTRNDAGQIVISEATLNGDLDDLQALARNADSRTESGDAVDTVVVTDTRELIEHQEAVRDEAAAEQEVTTEAEDNRIAAIDSNTSDSTLELREESPSSQDPAEAGTVTTEAAPHYYPNEGYSFVRPSFRDGFRGTHRYSDQLFKWNNENLTYNDGYEHDFKLSLGDGDTYLSKRQQYPGCFPHPDGRYFFSTLPEAGVRYLDTNFNYSLDICDPYWRAFTMGILHAGAIRNGKWYKTFIRMPNGGDANDIGTLEAQINKPPWPGCEGRFRPAWCGFKNRSRDGEGDVYLIDDPINKPVPHSWHWFE